jgi:hypothetical protein
MPGRRQNPDLFKQVRTGSEGKYRFTAVPPGAYKLFAFESAQPYRDAGFLNPYEARGVPVIVNGGVTATVTAVTRIPDSEMRR